MKTYLAVYLAPQATLDKWAQASQAEQEAGLDAWQTWMTSHKKEITDSGAPLGSSKRVSSEGVSDMRNELCGYTVVQADSHDEAAALFTDNPHLKEKSAWIEVLECLDMDMTKTD